MPFIAQMEAADCGAAALAMVLAYYGREESPHILRAACRVSHAGTTALELIDAATLYGLEAKAVRIPVGQLRNVAAPAILHWDERHFVVLERGNTKSAVLLDPSFGRMTMSWSELADRFSGVAILAVPSAGFERRSRVRLALRRYASAARGAWPGIAAFVATSLAIQALALSAPLLLARLIDRGIIAGEMAWVQGACAGFVAIIMATAFMAGFRDRLLLQLWGTIDIRLAGDIVRHILDLPKAATALRGTGPLTACVHGHGIVQRFLFRGSAPELSGIFLAVGSAALMIWNDSSFAIAAFGAAAVRTVAVHRLRRGSNDRAVADMRAIGDEAAALIKTVGAATTEGMRERQQPSLDSWKSAAVARSLRLKRQLWSDVACRQLDVAMRGTTFALLVGVGGQAVATGRVTLGIFVALLLVNVFFTMSTANLARVGVRAAKWRAHLAEVDDLLVSGERPPGLAEVGRAADVPGRHFARRFSDEATGFSQNGNVWSRRNAPSPAWRLVANMVSSSPGLAATLAFGTICGQAAVLSASVLTGRAIGAVAVDHNQGLILFAIGIWASCCAIAAAHLVQGWAAIGLEGAAVRASHCYVARALEAQSDSVRLEGPEALTQDVAAIRSAVRVMTDHLIPTGARILAAPITFAYMAFILPSATVLVATGSFVVLALAPVAARVWRHRAPELQASAAQVSYLRSAIADREIVNAHGLGAHVAGRWLQYRHRHLRFERARRGRSKAFALTSDALSCLTLAGALTWSALYALDGTLAFGDTVAFWLCAAATLLSLRHAGPACVALTHCRERLAHADAVLRLLPTSKPTSYRVPMSVRA